MPSHPHRLAVLISGNGSNLQAIINAIAANKLQAEICCVISDKAHAFGLQRAQQAGIPTHTLIKAPFEDGREYDQTLNALLTPYEPTLIILAGFMRILSAEFVASFDNRILNIHPSLLPRYPGLHTHKRVLEAGDQEHGTTVHVVIAELDAGPILAQARCNVAPNDDELQLKAKVQKLEHILYPEAIGQYLQALVPM